MPIKTLKILILGDSNVGKTTLLTKYVDNKFTEAHITTIAVEYKNKEIEYKNMKFNLQIWDTSGQEIYQAITKNFYRNADGIIFVYDVTNKDSFNNLKNWLNITDEYNKEYKKIIVGNKVDIENKREINKDIVERFGKENNIKCFEVSAKIEKNIESIFRELTELILENKTEEELREEFISQSYTSSIISKDTFKIKDEKKAKCC